MRSLTCWCLSIFKGCIDHCEEATHHLRAFLGDQYVSSDKPVFEALWENYNQCQFVEDEGGYFIFSIGSPPDRFIVMQGMYYSITINAATRLDERAESLTISLTP